MQRQAKVVGAAGEPVPPPDPRPYVPQITLPDNRQQSFLCVHDQVLGYLMHWVDNRHYPHRRDRDWCAGCQMGQTPVWQGFLGVLSMETLNRYVMRLPAAAFRNSGLFFDKSVACRLAGTVFTAYRFGQTKSKTNPAVIVEVKQLVEVPHARPWPMKGCLSRFWQMENLDELDQVHGPREADQKLSEELARRRDGYVPINQRGRGAKP